MTSAKVVQQDHLQGFITEQNFDQAEEAFPGIAAFYEHCRRKPSTFLDLVWQFEKDLAARSDLLMATMAPGLMSSSVPVSQMGETIEALPIHWAPHSITV